MKQSILSVLLGLSLGVIGFFVAANNIEEPPRIVEIWPIMLAIAVVVVVWLIQGAILALLARPKLKSIPILDMTRVYLAAQAAAAVTPFSGGEVAYQVLELKRRGLPADMGTAMITIKSVLNGAVLVSGTLVGLFFVPHVPFIGSNSGLPSSGIEILLVAAVGMAAAGALLAFIVRKRTLGSEEQRPEKHGRRAKILALREKTFDFVRHLKDSLVWIWRQEPRVVIACLGLMLLYWALYPLLGTLALRAAGWSGEGWLTVFLAQFVLFLVIPFAPTPGNSGAAEVAFVALMSDYAPHNALLGGMLIWRVLNHYSELVVGAYLAGRHLPEDIKIAKQELGSG